MLLALLVVLAQVEPTSSVPGGWAQFGFAGVLAAGIIGWLLKDRTRLKAEYDADIAAHREQLDLERKANRELYDRIIAQQERMAPILERAAHALEHAVGAR